MLVENIQALAEKSAARNANYVAAFNGVIHYRNNQELLTNIKWVDGKNIFVKAVQLANTITVTQPPLKSSVDDLREYTWANTGVKLQGAESLIKVIAGNGRRIVSRELSWRISNNNLQYYNLYDANFNFVVAFYTKG